MTVKAAMARVCRTTVQNAIREAVKRGHITVERRPVNGRKNLTNLIRIASSQCRLPEVWHEIRRCGVGAGLTRGPTIGFKTPPPKFDSKIHSSARAGGKAVRHSIGVWVIRPSISAHQ
jgi:hypothetical protein